jgi:hypothetical protein
LLLYFIKSLAFSKKIKSYTTFSVTKIIKKAISIISLVYFKLALKALFLACKSVALKIIICLSSSWFYLLKALFFT